MLLDLRSLYERVISTIIDDARGWVPFRGWPRRVHATARPADFAPLTMFLGRAIASGAANVQVAGWELRATLANVKATGINVLDIGLDLDKDEDLLLLLLLLDDI